ncbi:VPA1262 family N-terminal domain-containing protein [Pectobacterium cacticida]|uniref:VPA1262 family N-terminal domain-containing protein n=1 Tax=Pectobacterium cacticida TaxID=69221 RepID=UPI002FF05EDB
MSNTDKHWLYVMYTDEGILIFGCLVHGAEPWATIPKEKQFVNLDIQGVKVNILQEILNTTSAMQLTYVLENESSLKHVLPPLVQDIEFSCMCHHLADGFGRSAKPVVTFAAKQFISMPDDLLKNLLEYIEKDTGVSFRKTPYRLGTFEVFDVPANGEGHEVIRLEFITPLARNPSGLAAPKGFRLAPTEPFDTPLRAHVILNHAGMTVHNGLHTIEPGITLTVDSAPWSGYEISIFDMDGQLIQIAQNVLILRIGMNTQIQESTIHVNDRLTQSAAGLGKQIHNSASHIRPSTTMRSLTGVPDSVFEVHIKKARDYLNKVHPLQGSDRWFNKGVAYEVKVIEHFKHLLNSGRVKHSVIADPFFGEDALIRMVPRIKNPDLGMTIITSLSKQNPDTDKFDYDILKMRTALNGMRSGIVGGVMRGLRVINLVTGSTQAFHDRYLMLELHEGGREVYLLSNSFNKMSGNWPFCISKLDDAVSQEVGRYIDGLIVGQDITKSSSPKITLNWPNDEQTI